MHADHSNRQDHQTEEQNFIPREEGAALILLALCPPIPPASLAAALLLPLLKQLRLPPAQLRLFGALLTGRPASLLLGCLPQSGALCIAGQRHCQVVDVEAAELLLAALAGTGGFDPLLAVGDGGAGTPVADQRTTVATAQNLHRERERMFSEHCFYNLLNEFQLMAKEY